jgi:hypothetical protein
METGLIKLFTEQRGDAYWIIFIDPKGGRSEYGPIATREQADKECAEIWYDTMLPAIAENYTIVPDA